MNRWICRDLVAGYRQNLKNTKYYDLGLKLNIMINKEKSLDKQRKDLEISQRLLKYDIVNLKKKYQKEIVESHRFYFTHKFEKLVETLSHYFEV